MNKTETIKARCSKETRRQVELLSIAWGESVSAVIVRCVQQAFARQERKRGKIDVKRSKEVL